MKKSTKTICIISAILFWMAVMYLVGAATLPSFGLEYRFWVDSLGKLLCMQVIPLWLIGLGIRALWSRFHGKSAARWLIRLLGAVAGIAYLGWWFLTFLFIVFNTNEERYLGGGMLSVVVSSIPNPTSYDLYERVGLFFRRDSSLTQEAAVNFLEEKYKREFFPVETDDAVFFADMERPDVTVKVKFVNGEIQDDYPQSLADHYLLEGWQTMGLNWKYQFMPTDSDRERFCPTLDTYKDCTAFAEDVYNLVEYVLQQDALLKKYDVCLFYTSTEYEGDYACLRFGKYKDWKKLSTREYGPDIKKMSVMILWGYDSMRLRDFYGQRDNDQAADSVTDGMSASNPIPEFTPQPTPEPTPQLTEREMAEGEFPDQCEAAEAIWNAELKDLGYEYEPGFNAKGNLVIWLGKLPSDNLRSDTEESNYYLTYDRESKNGNCYLFVLSEEPEGSGLNNVYLREFYACEKETLKVVAGNKTGWAQPGCKEYREITGE